MWKEIMYAKRNNLNLPTKPIILNQSFLDFLSLTFDSSLTLRFRKERGLPSETTHSPTDSVRVIANGIWHLFSTEMIMWYLFHVESHL